LRVGCSAPILAARETDPTPVVTHSSDVGVSRVELTSSMVLGSRTRGGRSSAAIPDIQVRPEIEFRQEPEIDKPAEIQVSMFAICEGGSGTTRLEIPEIMCMMVKPNEHFYRVGHAPGPGQFLL